MRECFFVPSEFFKYCCVLTTHSPILLNVSHTGGYLHGKIFRDTSQMKKKAFQPSFSSHQKSYESGSRVDYIWLGGNNWVFLRNSTFGFRLESILFELKAFLNSIRPLGQGNSVAILKSTVSTFFGKGDRPVVRIYATAPRTHASRPQKNLL